MRDEPRDARDVRRSRHRPTARAPARAARAHWKRSLRGSRRRSGLQSSSATRSRSACGMKRVVPALFTSTSSRPSSRWPRPPARGTRASSRRRPGTRRLDAEAAPPRAPWPRAPSSERPVVDDHRAPRSAAPARSPPDACSAPRHDRSLALQLALVCAPRGAACSAQLSFATARGRSGASRTRTDAGAGVRSGRAGCRCGARASRARRAASRRT